MLRANPKAMTSPPKTLPSRRQLLVGVGGTIVRRHANAVDTFQRRVPHRLISLIAWKLAQRHRPNIRTKRNWNDIMRGISEPLVAMPNTTKRKARRAIILPTSPK